MAEDDTIKIDPLGKGLVQEIGALRRSVEDLSKRITELSERDHDTGIDVSNNRNGQAFVFEADAKSLRQVNRVSAPPLPLLLGIDRAKSTLLANTKRFANGFSANNALLWGARGMGKSTLVKSVFVDLAAESNISLIEIHREDILSLPSLMRALSGHNALFLIFCDDLSFNRPDRDFKALKSILEGGLDGRPDNILFYATSNRRHMLPKHDALNADLMQSQEYIEETVALSDRFGLWLGFHACSQAEYLAMVDGYVTHFKLAATDYRADALEWAKTRGNRSGRTAWQYVQNLAGEHSVAIHF